MRPVDGHPAHGVEQDDVVDRDRLGRVPAGRRWRRWPARRPAWPARGRHEGGPTAADLDELGQDRDGDLGGLLRAEVEAGRRPQGGDPLGRRRPSREQPGPDRLGPGRAGHQADVGRLEAQRRQDGLLVPGALAGDHDVRPDRRLGQARRSRPRPRPGPAGRRPPSATGSITVTAIAHRRAQLGRGRRDRARSGDPQGRRRQVRFHVDLQGSARVAGHDLTR